MCECICSQECLLKLTLCVLQVVLLSGHLDSWDVGQGAMDDGGGAVISWEALSLIKDLGETRVDTFSKTQYTQTVCVCVCLE